MHVFPQIMIPAAERTPAPEPSPKVAQGPVGNGWLSKPSQASTASATGASNEFAASMHKELHQPTQAPAKEPSPQSQTASRPASSGGATASSSQNPPAAVNTSTSTNTSQAATASSVNGQTASSNFVASNPAVVPANESQTAVSIAASTGSSPVGTPQAAKGGKPKTDTLSWAGKSAVIPRPLATAVTPATPIVVAVTTNASSSNVLNDSGNQGATVSANVGAVTVPAGNGPKMLPPVSASADTALVQNAGGQHTAAIPLTGVPEVSGAAIGTSNGLATGAGNGTLSAAAGVPSGSVGAMLPQPSELLQPAGASGAELKTVLQGKPSTSEVTGATIQGNAAVHAVASSAGIGAAKTATVLSSSAPASSASDHTGSDPLAGINPAGGNPAGIQTAGNAGSGNAGLPVVASGNSASSTSNVSANSTGAGTFGSGQLNGASSSPNHTPGSGSGVSTSSFAGGVTAAVTHNIQAPQGFASAGAIPAVGQGMAGAGAVANHAMVGPSLTTAGGVNSAGLLGARTATPMPTASDAMAALDHGVEPTRLLHVTPNQLAVGVSDPQLGWLEVRAERVGGQLSAQVMANSTDSHAVLAASLPAMVGFLQDQRAGVQHLAVANSLSGNAGQSGQGSFNQNASNQGSQQQSGAEAGTSAVGSVSQLRSANSNPSVSSGTSFGGRGTFTEQNNVPIPSSVGGSMQQASQVNLHA